MKSIDKWTAGCYVTVFSALLEYCVVLALVKTAEWEVKVRMACKITKVGVRKGKDVDKKV